MQLKNAKKINYGKKAVRYSYSKLKHERVELPYLLENQKNSFDWFLNEGISRLLADMSPIVSLNGDYRLYFENPKFIDSEFDTYQSKMRDLSYYKKINVDVKFEIIDTGVIKESPNVVLCSNFPYMTPSATFIINGAERVIVSQIVRASGAYFKHSKDEMSFEAFDSEIIPTRGIWLEYSVDSKKMLYAKYDRSKKIPFTALVKTLGIGKDSDIKKLFGDSEPLKITLSNDKGLNTETATVLVNSTRKGEDETPYVGAREKIRSSLFDSKKYDLAPIGRYKLNKKLDIFNRIYETLYYNKNAAIKMANDLVDNQTGEVVVSANTLITKEVVNTLKKYRHLLEVVAISKEDSLENDYKNDILAFPDPENPEILVVNKDIKRTDTGEKLCSKGDIVNQELIKVLRKNRRNIKDEVIRYFLNKDPYIKEKERKAVIVEALEILIAVKDEKSDIYSDKKVKLIGNVQTETKLQLTASDILASMSYYLNLYFGIGTVDDIDALNNRRIRPIGELLMNTLRSGLYKSEKNIQNKISILTAQELGVPDFDVKSIVSFSQVDRKVREFFGTNQLSQFMDQINPLAELTQKRRISASGSGGISKDNARQNYDVRDVQPSHYGRICPIETPEGQSIGLVSSFPSYAKIDDYGFIKTPYLKVIDGKVTNEIVYFTTDDEIDLIDENITIAAGDEKLNEDQTFVDEKIVVRRNFETLEVSRSLVTYMDVSPQQIVSVATSTIPFLEHDDAGRALMGANMQRQAVPLLNPDSPIVGTGIEYKTALDSGVLLKAEENGFVVYVDSRVIKTITAPKETVANPKSGEIVYSVNDEFTYDIAKKLFDDELSKTKNYILVNFKESKSGGTMFHKLRSNQGTYMLRKPIVKTGEFVEVGDVLADYPSTNNGELALGKNVRVAFMTWEGYNYEDAVIMNEDLVKNDVYTSIHIEEHIAETRETKGNGYEKITKDIPNVSKEATKYLDEDGVVVIGTEVKEGDILIGKVTPKGSVNELSPENKLIQAILSEKSKDVRDSSIRVKHGGGGIVQDVQRFSKKNGDKLNDGVSDKIVVYVAQKRKITEGDKMAGRHGNKGIISKILPREDMPFMEDGTPIDIMLNPLGVPSRMNIGQILEIHLGMAASTLGIKVATPVFDGANDADLNEIRDIASIPSDWKFTLYDGRNGRKFDNKISVGIMYMMKLSHMVDDKIHARNVGPYSLVNQQPLRGKANKGGQRCGEMEVWALYAYGAAHTLQEMLTIKSDDMSGRNKAFAAITNDRPLPTPSIPESFRVLIKQLQSLGLYVELINSKTGENEAFRSLTNTTHFKLYNGVGGNK